MLRYLLDTNIVIYVLKRRPVEVLSTFNTNSSRMAMSSVTLAELLHGAEKSSRVSENLAAIEDFCRWHGRLHLPCWSQREPMNLEQSRSRGNGINVPKWKFVETT